ncbi:MAG TPA: redox-sensing transcriptional repressor Rex, partial [Clostridiales bacterium]|nr:redox-sensing transcriptional repressor Rex [Clostridiales bacterium]
YGYNVKFLHSEIGKLLGIHENYRTIIIGAGNMGRALANHRLFEKRGFVNEAIFDINPEVVGTTINRYKVMHMDELESFTAANRVDIAILCVPNSQTAAVAERVASLGIRGLWNFSPMDLKLDREVVIENVHLGDGLMLLGYRLSRHDSQQDSQKK